MQHTVASQIAGATSALLLYPIDVVKIRFMSQDGTTVRRHDGRYYTSSLRALHTIWEAEGARALFRGCHVAIAGSTCAWGSYMFLYRSSKEWLNGPSASSSSVSGSSSSFSSWFVTDAALSLNASVLSGVVCCPIWLIKTRMQLECSAKAGSTREYHGVMAAVRSIWGSSGLRGFWAGVGPQAALAIPNSLNLPIYDRLKAWRTASTGAVGLSPLEVTVCSSFTKLCIMSMSHPLLVVKTRMQDAKRFAGDEVHYRNLIQSLAATVRREGVVGLYRGMVPSLIQAFPRSTITFVVYEQCLTVFQLGQAK